MKLPLLFSPPIFSLLFSAATIFSTSVLASDEDSQVNIPVEYVNSCKGLSEKDSCQIHGKTNALLNGSCKTKALSQDDFELICIADETKKDPAPDSDSALSDQGSHKHKHKGY
jgi:hypothetical protein